VVGFSGLKEYPSVGAAMANEFNYALLNYGFNVVERENLTRVMGEQSFSQSGAVEQPDVKGLGKLLGADLVIVGIVEKFKDEGAREISYSVQSLDSGGVSAYTGVSPSQVQSVGKKEIKKAVISVNFKIIDVETGQIVVAGSDGGTSKTGILARKKIALGLVKKVSSEFKKMMSQQLKARLQNRQTSIGQK
jgi:curli biogenesis system outer membrane secretion channel CsgG